MYYLFFIIANSYYLYAAETKSMLIVPTIPELYLKSADTNYTIKCYGKTSVTWISYEYMNISIEVSDDIIRDAGEYAYEYAYKSTLSLFNVSSKNKGYYRCCPKWKTVENLTDEKKKECEQIYVFIDETPSLNLTILGDQNKIISLKDNSPMNVNWTVQISAKPNAYFEWRDPNGEKLVVTKKFNVQYEKKDSVSRITILTINDLQLSDMGVYKLIAANKAGTKEISFTLVIEGGPSIQPSIQQPLLLYNVGTVYDFVFNISGYPIAIHNVSWTFKELPCKSCEYTSTTSELQIFKNNIIELSQVAKKIELRINVTKPGRIICSAWNKYGIDMANYTIFLTEIPNGFNISGPPTIISGDSVTVECVVAKYIYDKNILWTHSVDSLNDTNITFIETEISYYSRLTITNISKKFNGDVYCTVNCHTNLSKIERKSLSIKVEDPLKPMIQKIQYLRVHEVNGQNQSSIEMRCSAKGKPLPTLSWLKDSKMLSLDEVNSIMLLENGSNSLTINSINLDDNGIYACNASNRFGSDVSKLYFSSLDPVSNVVAPKDDTPQHNSLVSLCWAIAIVLVFLAICIPLGLILKREIKNKYLLPYDKQWEFPADKLKLGKPLGSGSLCVVFKATAVGMTNANAVANVAVKTLKPMADPSDMKTLTSELKIMIDIGRHLNIVNLLGVCTGPVNKQLMVIVEYCCFGSIHEYLRAQRDRFINQVTPDEIIDYDVQTSPENSNYEHVTNIMTTTNAYESSSPGLGHEHEWHSNDQGYLKKKSIRPTTTCDLIYWSFQVANAMDYLSSRKILHGDLAARNILLAEDNIVKICDFQFSKNMYNSTTYRMKKTKKILLPYKWMAIESIRDQIFSTKSDVWSFGILLWEIFSLASTPYQNILSSVLFDKLRNGYRMNQPKYANSEIYKIMLDCWDAVPKKRPSFINLTKRLRRLLQDSTMEHYIKSNDKYILKMKREKFPSADLVSVSSDLNCSKSKITITTVENLQSTILEHSDDSNIIKLKPVMVD